MEGGCNGDNKNKRGRCDSELCRARNALTLYLNKLLDDAELNHIDKERNTNLTILHIVVGNVTMAYTYDKMLFERIEEPPLITKELFCVLYHLCEREDDD